MRLYSLTGATAVDDGAHHYEPVDDGGFDFPADLFGRLHTAAVGGLRQWETAIERQQRTIAEELARQRDPASLYAAVGQLVAAANAVTPPAPGPVPPPAPAKPRGKAPAKAG